MTTGTTTRPRRRKSPSLDETVILLCKQHDPPSVRAALLHHWLAAVGLSPGQFPESSTTARFLQETPLADYPTLRQYFESSPKKISLKILEGAFESLIDTGRRRRQGAVYTPDIIIDYLLDKALDQLSKPHSHSQKQSAGMICDPACGSGGFLVRAAWHLHQRYSISLSQAVAEHVVGFDNDPQAISHANCLVEILLTLHGQAIPSDPLKIHQRDTLLESPELLLSEADAPHGFDVVATNPPYVKLQNLAPDYRRQLIDRYGPYIKGSFSLAPLFLLQGHRLLSENGCGAFITQNNLFTSLSGRAIRRYLQQQRAVCRIVDFGHQHIFANASAYTCLMFLDRKQNDRFQFSRHHHSPSQQSLSNATYWNIDIGQLCEKKWRLAEQRHLDNLRRIEGIGTELGNMADIHVGFATLKDQVFLVSNKNGSCLATAPDGSIFEIEPGLTRSAIKVADLNSQADLAADTLRVIFPYRKKENRFEVIPEEEIRKFYPQAYQYLSCCRKLLELRDKGKKRHEAWYAWGRSQSREAAGPKLLCKTFDRRPNFMLDKTDRLFCNGYSVAFSQQKTAPGGYSLEVLQRIVNSRIMHYYSRLTSFQIEGGYQCYQKNFIERFGIPQLSPKQIDLLQFATAEEVEQLLLQIYGLKNEDLLDVIGE